MYADAPDDPFLTYDPARSRLVLTSEDASLVDTTIQGLEGVATGEGAGRGEPLQSAVGESLRLTDPLARGGLGDVWVGVQRSLDRVVAIKRLRSDRLEDATAEQREQLEAMFRHEAFTTARLEHPNIVPVYTLGADPMGQALLAMKLVRGRPWDELLEEDRELPMAEFLARHLPILIDVSQAAAYAHSQGILHRDIKPQQVMVGEFGEVLLMDWGLAISFPGAVASWPPKRSPRSSGSSTAPGPAGTPSFMAPEQALGEMHTLGPWTDVYLLGASLYFLLTGTPPHLAKSGMAAMARAASGKLDSPSERAPGSVIPPELEELVISAMAADPEERRPATVPEFIEALQSYLSGATRRRRSRRLVQEVEAQLRGSRGSAYSELGHSLSRLREAETLWPENQRVAELQAAVLMEYAEVALRRGDLSLARVQASQLPAGRRRKELLRRIGAAQERRKLSKQQRGRFVGAFLGLISLLLVGTVLYVLEQRRAGERLENVLALWTDHTEEPIEGDLFPIAPERTLEARALAVAGRPEEGLASLERLLPRLRRGMEDDPANVERRYQLAQVELALAEIAYGMGRRAQAEGSWSRVVSLLEPLPFSAHNLYLIDSRVRALLHLGRVEEARPLAETLLARGWQHRNFEALSTRHGIAAPVALGVEETQ